MVELCEEFLFYVEIADLQSLNILFDDERKKNIIQQNTNVLINAVFMACRYNNYILLEWLVQNGANLNVSMQVGDQIQTPIGWAKHHKNTEMERFIASKHP